MQAVCAKCSRQMCRAVVLFLVAECAQTTPMIAPLPGDPNFSVDGSVAFFKSGESNPTQPNPPPLQTHTLMRLIQISLTYTKTPGVCSPSGQICSSPLAEVVVLGGGGLEGEVPFPHITGPGRT